VLFIVAVQPKEDEMMVSLKPKKGEPMKPLSTMHVGKAVSEQMKKLETAHFCVSTKGGMDSSDELLHNCLERK
jgi:hypothetical protein